MLVNLYTTLGCHLCEEALALLTQLQASSDIAIELIQVEISESDTLMERYGIRIPVIKVDASEAEIGWPFDLSQLSAFLLLNQPD